jgi:predicted transposase YdaD
MRRDTLFYKLFSQFPGLLFELVAEPPPDSVGYQFESVEVKESLQAEHIESRGD